MKKKTETSVSDDETKRQNGDEFGSFVNHSQQPLSPHPMIPPQSPVLSNVSGGSPNLPQKRKLNEIGITNDETRQRRRICPDGNILLFFCMVFLSFFYFHFSRVFKLGIELGFKNK